MSERHNQVIANLVREFELAVAAERAGLGRSGIDNGVLFVLGCRTEGTCSVSQSFENDQFLFDWKLRLGLSPSLLTSDDTLDVKTHCSPLGTYARRPAIYRAGHAFDISAQTAPY